MQQDFTKYGARGEPCTQKAAPPKARQAVGTVLGVLHLPSPLIVPTNLGGGGYLSFTDKALEAQED